MCLVRTWFMAAAIFAICYPGLTGATTFMVGDSMGWGVPTDISYYQTWATNKTFLVGDALYFNWTATHDVADVNKTDYEACTKVNSFIDSPVQIKLNTNGTHYYICTVGPHCTLGQKLAINVTTSMTNSTSPAATTPSAASSTTFGFFSHSVLLLVLLG